MILNTPNGLRVKIPDGKGWIGPGIVDSPKGQIEEVFDEKTYHRYFELESGMNVLDLGANIGIYAIYAAPKVHPGYVVSIEPYFPAYMILVENIIMNNLDNVIPLLAGVGKETGWGRMNIDKSNFRANRFPADNEGTIPRYSLKDLLSIIDIPIHFIKMDIETSEREILPYYDLDIPLSYEHHRWRGPGKRYDHWSYINQVTE